MEFDSSQPPYTQPIYEIRFAGHLQSRWFHWFDGFEMSNLQDGQMLLRGMCIDQSALRGVLEKIFDLQLTLLSVNRVDTNGKN